MYLVFKDIARWKAVCFVFKAIDAKFELGLTTRMRRKPMMQV